MSITCLFLIALVAAGLKGHCPLVVLAELAAWISRFGHLWLASQLLRRNKNKATDTHSHSCITTLSPWLRPSSAPDRACYKTSEGLFSTRLLETTPSNDDFWKLHSSLDGALSKISVENKPSEVLSQARSGAVALYPGRRRVSKIMKWKYTYKKNNRKIFA